MPGDAGVLLKPNPAFIPKVVNSIIHLELKAFNPQFLLQQNSKAWMCYVWCVLYVSTQRELKGSERVISCLCLGRRKPITKQCLSHWIVKAISLAYSGKGLTPPSCLCAHSTRGMSTSWALFKGVTLQDICEAPGWSSPHTFASYINWMLQLECLHMLYLALNLECWLNQPYNSFFGWQENLRQAIWQYRS